MIYIFHFFAVVSLYIFFGRNQQTKKIFLISTFLYVLFVFGQRWMTGTDFPNYLTFYINDTTRSEWGYFGLQTLFRSQSLYFGLLIFLMTMITQLNFYRFFVKFDNYTLMILLFLISEIFFAQMSQIRQYVAISFFINSYYHAYEKSYIKSVTNLILAFSFHAVSLYLLPLLFIKLPYSKKLVTWFFTAAWVFPLINIHFAFNLPFVNRYAGYIGGRFDVPLGSNHYIKYYVILLIIVFYLIHLKPLVNNKINRLIVNGLILYTFVYGFSFHFAPLYRVATFFQVFEIVFLVHYAKHLENLPDFFTEKVIAVLFVGIFSFTSLSDPYIISDYQFRPLRLFENRTETVLIQEIEAFHERN